ncbi:MAG: type I-C CRISPR-associated endonuclease Cas1 [Candidatus Sumerlaeia bacterium]|nr:type I-C CRISPR-associated endonuclease Cas1 [Candidatus Sumerlaeia bacterium]
MKQLLNTLYVTTEGAYLSKEGDTVCVQIEGETKLRIPIHTVGSIVCLGRIGASPYLMQLCGERDVALSFLSENGRFLARVVGATHGSVLLRREQYRRTDDEEACLRVAHPCVVGKIANARTVLLRGTRDHGDSPGAPALDEAARRLARLLQQIEQSPPLDVLRGMEGDAARIYFAAFDHLIVAQKDCFQLTERSRRPPLDPMNALLSFLYTMLVHDVTAALEANGLDPAVGYLHRDRPGRPSLALDLMEELRPFLADRLALSLVNRQQVKGSGFTTSESGAVVMDDATRRKVIIAWQERKREEITHPFLNEKIAIGLLPHVQALLLSRHLRGDLEAYPPFLWR